MLRLACFLCCVLLALGDNPKSLMWPMLGGVKGQWKISFALTSSPDKNVFVPHNCSSQLPTAPCNQPAMEKANDDRISVTYALKNATAPFMAFKNEAAEAVAVLLCYAPHSFVDRPWRKLKKAIWKDKNCAYTVGKKLPFPADPYTPTTVTMDFNTTTDLVTATWYVKVVVFCKDGTAKGRVCQFDETNTTNRNFFVTHKGDARTTGMIAAAAVMSTIGPIFFLVFYFVDSRRRKNM